MTTLRCEQGITEEALASWWLQDAAPEADAKLEEHLFQCAACTERARRLAAVGRGVRLLGSMTRLPPVVTPVELRTLQSEGFDLASEEVRPGDTCLRPMVGDRDGVLFRLFADLGGVSRVNLEIAAPSGQRLVRLLAVPFDRERGEVLLACLRQTAEVVPESVIRLYDADVEPPVQIAEYRLVHPAT